MRGSSFSTQQPNHPPALPTKIPARRERLLHAAGVGRGVSEGRMRGVVLMCRDWRGYRCEEGVGVGCSRGRLRVACRRWRGRERRVLRIRGRGSESS